MPNPVLDTLIASTIQTVAGKLGQKLRGALGSDAAPGVDVLQRAIELLTQIGAFDIEHLPSEVSPESVEFWLRRLLRTPTALNPILNKDTLAKLFGRCFGVPNGNTMLPKNRTTLPPPPGGGRQVDYLYEIDQSSIPSLPGITAADFEKLIEGAWDRWIAQSSILTVQRATSGQTPNMTIRFGALDGTGQKLAETTTMFGGGVATDFRIVIDAQESWNKSKLLATMTHELGHALGLDHVVSPSPALMAAFLDPSYSGLPGNQMKTKIVLAQSDLAAFAATPWA
ncbi:MAG: matrixin family metalloprotease [Planctomycetales bacterium]